MPGPGISPNESRSRVVANCSSSAGALAAPLLCSRPVPGTLQRCGACRRRGRALRCSQRWRGSHACVPTTVPVRTSCPASSATVTRWRCRAAHATSSSICASCCVPPMCQAPMFWSVTPSVAWLPACMRPSTRASIVGLLSIDAQNEDFVAAYKEFLTPEQYSGCGAEPPASTGSGDLLSNRATQPGDKCRPGSPSAGGHSIAPDSAHGPLPLARPCQPVRLPARIGRSTTWSAPSRRRRTCWPDSCPAHAT